MIGRNFIDGECKSFFKMLFLIFGHIASVDFLPDVKVAGA
jgi:hypothetical protein